MISNDATAATVVSVLPAVSAADTAAATSGWIDCRKYKGKLKFIINSGTITGSTAGKLQGADDAGGTNAADITGATHTAISTASQVRTIVIRATERPFVKYVGTVTTGPILISVTLEAHPGSV
ncbi:MAG: hypothetical protein RLZZ524_1060 [Pseudomonadota bacterium]